MRNIFKLDKNISIGDKKNILVIPEIGINHFGNLSLAKQIVLSAKKAGAIAIKAQVHIPDKEMSLEAKNIKPGNSNLSIYEVIRRNCLTLHEEEKLKKFIDQQGMLYIASCFCIEAADFLKDIGTKVFKIGSGECNHFPLLDRISSYKKPMIVSTGMHTLKEVDDMVKFLSIKKTKFAINHCVNLYPTPTNLTNFHRLKYLIKKYSNKIQVGLSDHSLGLSTCYTAIGLGVNMIEKHYVVDRKKNGPDISASLDCKELNDLIKFTYEIKKSLNKKQNLIKEELVTKKFALHSAVASQDIKKGERITKKKVKFLRPGTGNFLSKNYKIIYKSKAKKNIKKNQTLKQNDI